MAAKPETVPIRIAKSVLRVVEAQGYDIDDLLTSLGIDFNPLTAKPCPEFISAALYNKLYSRVVWLLQDECFGLHLREKIPAGTFRMMCYHVIHCDTLERAIVRCSEFNAFCRNLAGLKPLQFNPLEPLDATRITNVMPDDERDTAPPNLISISASLHMWRRFCGWLIGKPLELNAVLFRGSAPGNTEALRSLFDCELIFGAPHNGLRFARSYLTSPVVQTEDTLRQFLRTAPYQLSVMDGERADSTVARMRMLIGNDFSREFPGIDTMANALNVSVRTLRRRLTAEGTTFQAFKDQTRVQAAINYLNHPELKINAVSALLGFDEPSAFHRSFKKWTSMTPGEYRARLGSGVKFDVSNSERSF